MSVAASTPPPSPSSTLRDDPAPPVAKEGVPFILAFVGVTVLLAALGYWVSWASWIGYAGAVVWALLSVWCIWFFRDPARSTPAAPGLIISPADGRVVLIGPAPPPPEVVRATGLSAPMQRVCVFMNVFNVHVNRAPVEGTVAASVYHEGKFFNASLDKASEHNERSSVVMKLAEGGTVIFTQIAGLVARRIVTKVKGGETLRRGQRYGLIRFGSRVDVYLPEGYEVAVKVGDITVAGESVIARRAAR